MHVNVANGLREGLGVSHVFWLLRSVRYLWIRCPEVSSGWAAALILLVHVEALISSLGSLNVH